MIKWVYTMGKHDNANGYSLLEVLTAMALFLMIIVPFMGYISTSVRANKGRDMMTAACILEQEAARMRLYPEEIVTTKMRRVQGEEWSIKLSMQGEQLKQCKLNVYKRNKIITNAVFYVYDSK